MSNLPDELFNLVEKSILAARDAAEEAAQAALNTLAVNRPTPYDAMSEGARKLRRALRAKARQLGEGSQVQGLQPLVEEIAYQQWHRMLFARFLAENDLLMHPTGVPVTLQDCSELANEEGEADAWAVAAKYASEMLPGIFRLDDPVVKLRFAPEGRQELERILVELPQIVFQSDDSLGWMYQFWQTKKKEEINASERKIGGADLAPVTQLFTEDYMVRFLLENSLGAWWAARYPDSPLIKEWQYLRFREDGTPAAGTFPGWPDNVAEVTVMDPCCGSGHFLVAAFDMLRKMRMEAEEINEIQAADAVIRDNLFGLEIDPRCTQIATFYLAFAAWKVGGYRELPMPNVACSGIPVKGSLDRWIKHAGDDDQIIRSLTKLYSLFENAPCLGSLIDPSDISRNEPLISANFGKVKPVFERALELEGNKKSTSIPKYDSLALDALQAARLLDGKYHLIITNVPFLSGGKQSEDLSEYISEHYQDSKNDLATVFLERCKKYCCTSGSYAMVLPQNWTFLVTYKNLRRNYLKGQKWNLFVRLGPKAFRTPLWDFNVGLFVITNTTPIDNKFFGIDITKYRGHSRKASILPVEELKLVDQSSLLKDPQSRVIFDSVIESNLLSDYVTVHYGSKPGQTSRVVRYFWDVDIINPDYWVLMEGTPEGIHPYTGKNKIAMSISFIENEKIDEFGIRGADAWGKSGIILSQMNTLPCSIYLGEFFSNNTSVIIPKERKILDPVFRYMSSPDYRKEVRKRNQKLDIDTNSMIDIPFDLEKWQNIHNKSKPLPAPETDDPTQWLFDGFPVQSINSLHVAMVRLLGYRWPKQKIDNLETYTDEDGIVCLTPVVGEDPAADRLRDFLQVAYGDDWSVQKQSELLAEVGFGGKTLTDWLRDGFFKQHVKLFKNRPFIWHIWDGRRDGFRVFVNYHKLDANNLDRLIYTYLGSWIKLQRDKRDLGEAGADGRLVAAIELQENLEAIREGEPPYDIYVRWKSLAEQPVGWNPDLNDGVRLNIRPFVTAAVLRNKFTINWNKDRGKNPDGSERHNDLHFTIAEKKAGRGN